MRPLRTSLIAAAAFLTLNCGASGYKITSPSGTIAAEIINDGALSWTVSHDGREVLSKSPISMTLTDGTVWGAGAKVSKAEKTSVSNTIATPFCQSSSMTDRYNGITLKMKGDWSIEFRAYDDGVAYRFVSSRRKPFEIRRNRSSSISPPTSRRPSRTCAQVRTRICRPSSSTPSRTSIP